MEKVCAKEQRARRDARCAPGDTGGRRGGTAGEEEGRPRGEPGEGSRGGEDTRQTFGETARTERSQRRRCGAVPLSQRTLTRAGLVPPLLALN